MKKINRKQKIVLWAVYSLVALGFCAFAILMVWLYGLRDGLTRVAAVLMFVVVSSFICEIKARKRKKRHEEVE